MIKKHYYVATTRYARITQITSGQINIFFKRPMILFGNKNITFLLHDINENLNKICIKKETTNKSRQNYNFRKYINFP